MWSMGRRTKGLAAVGALCLGLSRNAEAQKADTTQVVTIETVDVTVYQVQEAAEVPSAMAETSGRAPSKDAIWLPGFWSLRGDRNTGSRGGWVWVAGRWVNPPVQNARWDPAHWGWADDWWSFIPGHWVQPGPHGYPPSLQQDQQSRLRMTAQ